MLTPAVRQRITAQTGLWRAGLGAMVQRVATGGGA